MCSFFKSFVSRDTQTMLKFFTVYVRPMLEYCSIVWSPTNQGDINSIERVQRYYTSKIPCCSTCTYSQRLSILSLHSLQFRRTIADITYLYSIVSGEYDISLAPYLIYIPPSVTRGHSLKILSPLLNYSSSRQNFLSRSVHIWNNLPISTFVSTSRSSFRNKIVNLLSDPFIV